MFAGQLIVDEPFLGEVSSDTRAASENLEMGSNSSFYSASPFFSTSHSAIFFSTEDSFEDFMLPYQQILLATGVSRC